MSIFCCASLSKYFFRATVVAEGKGDCQSILQHTPVVQKPCATAFEGVNMLIRHLVGALEMNINAGHHHQRSQRHVDATDPFMNN